jgi:hypothetical protein
VWDVHSGLVGQYPSDGYSYARVEHLVALSETHVAVAVAEVIKILHVDKIEVMQTLRGHQLNIYNMSALPQRSLLASSCSGTQGRVFVPHVSSTAPSEPRAEQAGLDGIDSFW